MRDLEGDGHDFEDGFTLPEMIAISAALEFTRQMLPADVPEELDARTTVPLRMAQAKVDRLLATWMKERNDPRSHR